MASSSVSLSSSSSWAFAVPDFVSAALATAPIEHDADLILSAAELQETEFLERKAMLMAELRKLGGASGLEGLPAYRFIHGEDVPAADSPSLTDDNLRRFLARFGNDAAETAEALLGTLQWRLQVMPNLQEGAALEGTHSAILLREKKRFRELGTNRDGDFVVGLDLCWGHFISEEAQLPEILRMILLGGEHVVTAADACGHPGVVAVVFGGPAPVSFARIAVRVLERHYPGRLKRCVVYPVPAISATIAESLMIFMRQETREAFRFATEEAQVVEAANLTGPEQLPEGWRGGIEAVMRRDMPDESLLTSLVMDYMNPLQDDGSEAERAVVEGSWLEDPGERARAVAAVTPAEESYFTSFDPTSWMGLSSEHK